MLCSLLNNGNSEWCSWYSIDALGNVKYAYILDDYKPFERNVATAIWRTVGSLDSGFQVGYGGNPGDWTSAIIQSNGVLETYSYNGTFKNLNLYPW